MWVAFGLLECVGDSLYDSAVLIDADGEVKLTYRRISPQWHGAGASPDVYRQGEKVGAVETPWGKIALLICGDLFDDAIVAQARALSPDWLLFPFARCFAGGGTSQVRWDSEEMPAYAARVRAVGTSALMANYLADVRELPDAVSSGGISSREGYFGGAFVVRADGTVVAQKPLGASGMLVVDVA